MALNPAKKMSPIPLSRGIKKRGVSALSPVASEVTCACSLATEHMCGHLFIRTCNLLKLSQNKIRIACRRNTNYLYDSLHGHLNKLLSPRDILSREGFIFM